MKTRIVLKSILGVFITCLVVVFGSIFIESQFHLAQRLMDDLLYDNRNHYLSCEQLPTVAEVESVLTQHKDVVKQIEQVDSPGYVQVVMDDGICAQFGTADILIMYPSHADRIKIQQIINSNTFFGIPYRLLNT